MIKIVYPDMMTSSRLKQTGNVLVNDLIITINLWLLQLHVSFNTETCQKQKVFVAVFFFYIFHLKSHFLK